MNDIIQKARFPKVKLYIVPHFGKPLFIHLGYLTYDYKKGCSIPNKESYLVLKRRNNMGKKIILDCPLCGKYHEVTEKTRLAKVMIKGEDVQYVEFYYDCPYVTMNGKVL